MEKLVTDSSATSTLSSNTLLPTSSYALVNPLSLPLRVILCLQTAAEQLAWLSDQRQTIEVSHPIPTKDPHTLPTPRLNEKTDSGKSHLQDLARWLRTSQRVDIQKISQFYWALFEKTRFLCFYIIKSMARKGYFGPKSDFRGSKIPPRGASSTWNM